MTTPETDKSQSAASGFSRRSVLGFAGVAGAALFAPAAARAVAPTSDYAPANVAFSTLGGVPVYYGLETSPRTWYCTAGFLTALNSWMSTLQTWSSGLGSVSNIGSAGFYVNKPGQHGAGTAIDLSIVRWSSGAVSNMFHGDHAAPGIAERRRYFAVEATLRRHFRFVLDGNYNAAHANHFHADWGGLPERRLLTGSRADTVFAQAVCNNFIGSSLAVDGIWGALTQAQVDILKSRLGVTGNLQTSQAANETLLSGLAAHGFANQAI